MKIFNAEQFVATQFSTAEDKAKFANHFVRFCESGFSETLFPKWFYSRLSNCFSHIAHYDIHGFYETWFRTTASQAGFVRHCLTHGAYGDPHFTFCDVERVLHVWLRQSGLLDKLESDFKKEIELKERAELARLKAKYEA